MGNSTLSSNGLQIANSRYFINENEDWEKLSIRVGREIARPENGDIYTYQDKFSEIIYNMDFLPGGRILRNAGRPRGSLFNCFLIPIDDSIEQIGQFLKDALTLWSEGGGVGTNLSFLRPRGAKINGKGGSSSGPVSFLEAADAVASTIESGGQRRAAGLACMHVSHPDVMEFIDAKLVHGKISHFNLSVLVDESFLEAVETDSLWQFKFAQKDYGQIPAREIWDKIISNAVAHAEPGILHWNNIRSNNSYYYDGVIGSNPCVTGDTMIYVADGRKYVDIKTLAEEGKDVPVFCFNEGEQKPEVRMMRRPRVTGRNKKILKVNFDDGSSVRCTENHKFYMKDGGIKRADELLIDDRLHHMVSYDATFEEIFKGFNSKSSDYTWLNTGFSKTFSEHRIVAEFGCNRKLCNGEVVHHKDYNSLNNSLDNLEVMTKKDHDLLHSEDMLGKKNPMNRFPEKNWLIKQDHSGNNNGRFKGYTPEQVFEIAVNYSIKLGRRITQDEWYTYCREKNVPNSRYSIGEYSSPSKMLLEAAKEAKVVVSKHSAHIREYKKYLDLLTETDMDIFFKDGRIYVNRVCEMCGEVFSVVWWNRERAFCSRVCSGRYAHSNEKHKYKKLQGYAGRQLKTRLNQIKLYNELKYSLNRTPMKKEWEKICKENKISYRIRSAKDKNINEYCFTSYKELQQAADLNFKVVSVEEDGYEDVYNGTVDGNHNFYIMTSESTTKSKKPKYNNVLCRQCGEAILEPYGVCNLGSLVLPNFITGTVNTNWQKLKEVIGLAVRFLDNVIEVNKYVLKENDIKAHNSRRIGIGVMGLAEYLFAKRLRYGSEKAIQEVEKLMRFIRDNIYWASIELAKEKGAFPRFDPVSYGKAHFIRSLPAQLRMEIKEHGIRNVTGLALAPTGTISLLPEVTSGIEPLFRKAYLRSDRVGNRVYVHPIYKDILEQKNEIPEWFVDTDDLKPEDHLETQVATQRYVDGAVSKTINMPEGTTADEFGKLTLEYIHDLKGLTVYVDGSREGQILNKITDKELLSYINNGLVSGDVDVETTKCTSGSCEI
jgi:ribonucleotide reductase alpha subunit